MSTALLPKRAGSDRPLRGCDHIDEADGAARRPYLSSRRGWICYDAQCRFCTRAAHQCEKVMARRGFEFVPLQTPWVRHRLGLGPLTPLTEMRVLTTGGQITGGIDAVLFLCRQVWWTRPILWLARVPSIYRALRESYRWVAEHRGCDAGGACLLTDRANIEHRTPNTEHRMGALPIRRSMFEVQRSVFAAVSWLPLLILALALVLRSHVPAWLFMWAMAGAIFFDCKWLTFVRARRRLGHVSRARSLGYLFFWPGMDAPAFLGTARPVRPGVSEATAALLKTSFGAFLLFRVAPMAGHDLLAGWIGMISLIFILHFGLFHLLSVLWRSVGVNAQPIMHAPIRASSLTDFWGRRWNGAFNQLVLDLFFRRFARSFGVIRATLTAFLISGLIHELVISLPAGGGYGLPTAYFLLQGWGVVVQRNLTRRRDSTAGWILTMLLTAGPAFFLFHPLFVRQVILPFLQAIGAL